MITVAALSPSLDLTYLVDSFVLGRIHRNPEAIWIAGGKALNMARAVHALRAESQVVALLGGSTGHRLRDLLRDEEIDVVAVESPTETRTCVAISSTDTGQLTEIYQDAPPIPEKVWLEFYRTLRDVLAERPGWLSISGRAPAGLSRAIGQLVELGHQSALKVAVDTHSEALPLAVRQRPALVKINRAEAAHLLDVPDETDLVEMAARIHQLSGGAVVLTDSTAGAVGLDDDGAVHVQGPDLHGTFPVGSGDSFLGGLVASLDRGQGLREAMRMATACAVANALVPGQGRFDIERARLIAAEVRVRDLR